MCDLGTPENASIFSEFFFSGVGLGGNFRKVLGKNRLSNQQFTEKEDKGIKEGSSYPPQIVSSRHSTSERAGRRI